MAGSLVGVEAHKVLVATPYKAFVGNQVAQEEEGILVDYDLFPHEVLNWDNNKRIYKVRLKYTPLLKFKKALKDLGIMYDEEYWGE